MKLDFTEEIETNHIAMKLLAKFNLKRMQKRYFKDLENEINNINRNFKEQIFWICSLFIDKYEQMNIGYHKSF